MPKHDQVLIDLGESICDLIDTYVTGHDLTVAAVIGVLQMISEDLIETARRDAEEDEDEEE